MKKSFAGFFQEGIPFFARGKMQDNRLFFEFDASDATLLPTVNYGIMGRFFFLFAAKDFRLADGIAMFLNFPCHGVDFL